MQTVTVMIIFSLLYLANYDNMAIIPACSDYLLFEFKNKRVRRQPEWYLPVSVPKWALGRGLTPGPVARWLQAVMGVAFPGASSLQPGCPRASWVMLH